MFLLKNTTHRMVLSYHPKVGHLWVPNQYARIPHERGAYVVRTNAQGFRSDWDFAEKKSGRPRILFFGDSLTAGDGCSNHERFSDIVGEKLGAETYNFGVSGSGPDQHLLIYREFARKIEADLIVLCVFVENIERVKASFRPTIERSTGLKRLVPKPYFTLAEDGRLELHHVPVPRERPEELSSEAPKADIGAGRNEQHRRLNRILHITDKLHSHRHLGPLMRMFSPKTIEDHTLLRSKLLKAIGFQPYPDYSDPGSKGRRLLKAIITDFISESAPVPVMIVPIPSVYYYLDELRPAYDDLFNGFSGLEGRTHVVDTTGEFKKLPREDRKRIPFIKDLHLSPYGHGLMADIIAKFIEQLKLLPQKELSEHTEPKTRTVSARPKKGCSILGISCFYHNSAASLITDGKIVAAAEEERFTRIKNDRNFPAQAVNYCLEEARLDVSDLKAIVYYDDPYKTFERIMKTFSSFTGDKARNLDMWNRVLPPWIQYKLHIPSLIRKLMRYDGEIICTMHHRSHAASAFYPSPFRRSAILTVDGVGEWATAAIGRGDGKDVSLLKEMRFPNSLGLLYSAFTQFTGFKVNSGEYKMMGLAPYGEPIYVDKILGNVVRINDDGSLELCMDYFSFCTQTTMTSPKMADLFGGPARRPDERITKREMDIARSIQWVTEECLLKMAKEAHRLTGEEYLCMAGGVALNCVANGRILRESPFKDIWIQPAAGDAGASLGAAFDAYHTYLENERILREDGRSQQAGSCWGPSFSDDEIHAYIDTYGCPARKCYPEQRADEVAKALARGEVVGNFSGRTEFGPRALGSRSILGDARNEEMQVNMNLRIKYRESFRPFAPVVLRERLSDYFELDRESPYMLLVAQVKKDICRDVQKIPTEDMLEIVRQTRSSIPAVTHVDYSARIQTILREDNPEYYDVVKAFEKETGCAVMVNTSFNVRGEPIVNTPEDAYRCFMRTDMDMLALGNYLLIKKEQTPWKGSKGHVEEDEQEAGAQKADMSEDLERIYCACFLPAVLNSSPRPSIMQVSWAMPSRWTELKAPARAKEFFLPDLERSGHMDSQAFAKAVISRWDDKEFGKAMMPTMTRLLDLLEKYPPPEDFSEDVSESVYVMF